MSGSERVSAVEVSVRTEAPAARRSTLRANVAGPLVGLAVLAAAVAVDPAGLRPFESLRWLVVSATVSAAVLAVARLGRHRPIPLWASLAWGVVVVSMAAAAATGLDPVTAWLGHPQRHLGVLAWVLFAAAFVVGATSTPGTQRVWAYAAVGAGMVVGATSVADVAGWSPLGNEFAGGRIGALLGQPTSLAALSVLLLPIAAAAPAPRWIRYPTVAGLCVALVGAQTRGALVGLAVAGLVSLPALRRAGQGSRVHLPVALGAIAVAAVLALSPLGSRLVDPLDSGRLDEWAVATRVIAERPLLGTGPEGYRIAVLDELHEGYVAEHGREVVVDRAHAAPLDVAASGGVLAALAHLLLLGGTVTATWRLQRDRPWSTPAAAGVGAVGFLVAGFFAFPVPALDVVAWVFAGAAVAAVPWAHTVGIPRRLLATAGAVLLVITLVAGVTDVVADRRLGRAIDEAAAGDVEAAATAATSATDLRPDLIDAWYVAAQVSAQGETILDLDRAISLAEEGLARFPDDPALRAQHARLLTSRAVRSELRADREAADAALTALVADDPTSQLVPRLRDTLENDG